MTHKIAGTLLLLTTALLGCTGVPKGLKPVSEFDEERYLGKWYEIARLDHSFETNMSNVSAVYAEDRSGGITVLNRGYNEKTGEWKQINPPQTSLTRIFLRKLPISAHLASGHPPSTKTQPHHLYHRGHQSAQAQFGRQSFL